MYTRVSEETIKIHTYNGYPKTKVEDVYTYKIWSEILVLNCSDGAEI